MRKKLTSDFYYYLKIHVTTLRDQNHVRNPKQSSTDMTTASCYRIIKILVSHKKMQSGIRQSNNVLGVALTVFTFCIVNMVALC